ncbi:MAG TPA: serine/threonine-protein kinase [Polyangiaceae bacterium]|nr:serine/threonine-protein kinase [Polyangiaceae bacterium]
MSEPANAAVKSTLRFGTVEPRGTTSFTGTIAGVAPPADSRPTPVDLGETLALPEESAAPPPGASMRATASGRSAVLPRRKAGERAQEPERPRFEHVRLLGEGGMGQVELARDNDIRRTVAVKRLHAEAASDEAMLRFADEVRIVGQLEHPAIVPVYDVGRDESGQVYLVMKHLSGETMEQVIEKLRSGDATYREKYSFDFRAHLFLGVLDAMRYAHARGVIHRDLKPANVMIGPYGEVTVLDWGIAKPIHRKEGTEALPLDRTALETGDKRLQETQLGALAGTPLYMSPEQAAGRNDELDERSDVYSLSVLFYEWLTLEHPLREKKTLPEVLAAIISGEVDPKKLAQRGVMAGVPAEWMNLIARGLAKEREQRYQSVAELEDEIRGVLDGRVKIACHVTFSKRIAYEFLAWMDRHPLAYLILFHVAGLCLVLGLGWAGYRALRGAH